MERIGAPFPCRDCATDGHFGCDGLARRVRDLDADNTRLRAELRIALETIADAGTVFRDWGLRWERMGGRPVKD